MSRARRRAAAAALLAAPALAAWARPAAAADAPSPERCLTQAVYHEAGREPLAGREAVARVVLARLAHPAYPKSVCAVVYQGAARRTGCQFTFTCDGALARPVDAARWAEAAAVARAALAGALPPAPFSATHYHADYVQPYWASSLTHVGTIGRHLFYALGAARTPPAALAATPGEGAPRPATFSVWGLAVATLTPTAAGVAVEPR